MLAISVRVVAFVMYPLYLVPIVCFMKPEPGELLGIRSRKMRVQYVLDGSAIDTPAAMVPT